METMICRMAPRMSKPFAKPQGLSVPHLSEWGLAQDKFIKLHGVRTRAAELYRCRKGKPCRPGTREEQQALLAVLNTGRIMYRKECFIGELVKFPRGCRGSATCLMYITGVRVFIPSSSGLVLPTCPCRVLSNQLLRKCFVGSSCTKWEGKVCHLLEINICSLRRPRFNTYPTLEHPILCCDRLIINCNEMVLKSHQWQVKIYYTLRGPKTPALTSSLALRLGASPGAIT